MDADPLARGQQAWFRRAVLAALLASVLLVGWLAQNNAGPLARDYVSGAAFAVSALLAAVSSGAAAIRRRGGQRRPWALLCAAGCAWALGNTLTLAGRLLDHQDSFPGPADVLHLAALPLAAGGLLSFSGAPRRITARLRLVLEGVVVAGSLLFISWAAVLSPPHVLEHETPLAKLVALAYPLGDIVIATLGLLVAVRNRPGARLRVLLVAGGMGARAVADGMYAYLTGVGEWSMGTPVDAGWVVACLMIALAPLAPGDSLGDEAQPEPRRTLLGDLAPYAAPMAALGLALAKRVTPHSDLALFSIGAALLVTLGLRQFVIVAQNLRLTRDLEERVAQRTAELDAVATRFRCLVQHSSDVTLIVGPDQEIVYVSPSAQRVLGYAKSQLSGASFDQLIHADDARALESALASAVPSDDEASIQARFRRSDGSWAWGEVLASDLSHEPSVGGVVVNFRDLSERLELEEQLRRQAHLDPLTELPNRAMFSERLEEAVAVRKGGRVAVLLLDLDGFKSVNDGMGHSYGDALLNGVAQRLQGCVRRRDLVARFGGDEFAVLVDDAFHEEAIEVAERILAALKQPFVIEGKTFFVQASIGIANGASEAAVDLLRNADVAMYAAKEEGKARYKVFRPTMHQNLLARLELEADLRLAIEREELVLHYQPLLSLKEGMVTGLEALVRWQHPARGLVPPSDFIPLAEETGLIVPIGLWTLRQACRQARAWLDANAGQPPVSVSVNLSPVQLRDEHLPTVVAQVLAETGLPASCLTLEVTESVVMEESHLAVERLGELADLGVSLSIDDFGAEYSSLGRLRSFPVDELKIDRSFVSEIASADEDAPLITGMIAMAHSLGLVVVAEGVETPEQVAFLRRHRCDRVQGFLFSHPIVSDDVLARLADGTAAAALMARWSAESRALRLTDLVTDAATEGGTLESVARPLLAELQRRTGLESTYVTRIHWDRVEQEILYSHNGGRLHIPEGAVVAWSDTLCRRALMGGPDNTDDVPGRYPESESAKALGIQSYVSVPVVGPNGTLFGTLCGASSGRRQVPSSLTVVMRLFAELLAEHLAPVSRSASSEAMATSSAPAGAAAQSLP